VGEIVDTPQREKILRELHDVLDEVPVSLIAAYLGERMQVGEGETALILSYTDRRYDRLKLYDERKRRYPSRSV
jgi:hypothetical protein